MNIFDFKKKTLPELEKLLLSFYRDKFKLLLEKTSGAEFKKHHLLRNIKKNISRVLTFIREKK